MFTKFHDFHFFILSVLFLSFVTSNHFLILNEETVVAICFIAFIVFSFRFIGKPEALDERCSSIKDEFHQALTLEKKYCEQVMLELENNKTGAFISMAKSLVAGKLAWYKISRHAYINMETTLKSLIGAKLDNRIFDLLITKNMFEQKWLDLVATEFEASCTFEAIEFEEVLSFLTIKNN